LAASQHPDLVVLDLGLPDLDGVDVIRGLRARTAVPIIVLSGRVGSSDKVAALDAGADDYVTKPFGIDELLARIRAVTRRHAPAAPPPIAHIGQYIVDLSRPSVRRADGAEQIRLTPTEWHLLEILIRNPGKLVGQRLLLREVWGPQYQSETHYLRQYMAQLRRKLEDDPAHPRYLLTEPGMGYRFLPDRADAGSVDEAPPADATSGAEP
jgi:two-component system, OmpR family, KDP operon response regulator KdpE